MLKEVLNLLNLRHGSVVLDATIGGGGHAAEMLKGILPGGQLIGFDADRSAIDEAERTLKCFKGSFKLINGNFKDMGALLLDSGIKSFDAILFDVGVSSYQLENSDRGFSITRDARLDMRMDPRLTLTAYDIVNRFKEHELAGIIEKFGEERFHKRIARLIVEARSKRPIESTHDLAAIVRRAIGFRSRRARIDPATRTFQAIRIAVNNELEALEEGLKQAVSWLSMGARIGVISFHSLEDRIVKNLFRGYSGLGILKIITKKPLRPQAVETVSNPRSRSGRLRVAERI